jgi:hypothetical protein
MIEDDTKIPPPKNPLTAKINTAILGFYFDWFAKKYLPTFNPVITSSYRDPDKNHSVGGAENSAHLHGLAYDFVLTYANGQAVPKAQAKAVFEEFVKPNWAGFALWEENQKGVWHIHVNLSRRITEYAAIMAVAGMGVIGFHLIKSLGGSKHE